MPWTDDYRARLRSPVDAVQLVTSGARVTFSGNAGVPRALLEALCARSADLRDVEVLSLLSLGDAPWALPERCGAFRANALFIGANLREAVNAGRADYTPIFLSEIPRLFRERTPIDVALVQVSPPDAHGYCSLGVSVDVVMPAAHQARHVIAEVNPRCPRTHGDAFLHVSRFAAVVEAEHPLPELPAPPIDDVSRRIGGHVAGLVEDGDTLQLGIGAIPDAVLDALAGRRDLGIHTEMFSDGVMRLVERGVITGERKPLHRGKVVSSFLMGSEALYRWVHDNPVVEMHPSDYTNDPVVIARHDRFVAVNSAIQVDLTGQVVSDSIGTRFYSGIGGQVDFIRGAARAAHGRPVIALPSTARGGAVSRIVSELDPGAGVVTSRGDVHFVVTEWGVADLWGRPVRERARRLIAVAHPAFREGLEERARARNLV
ncbi:MAG: 4-hydroxybutyrate CoA-transferase [Planctomycetes bacterium]|nr:4-hydroxybutyrate CoA-transferase [Planctomycetota bacterium]